MRLWAMATRTTRTIGDTTYTVFTDGSLRRLPPKVRGHAAVKAAKQLRRYSTEGRRVI